ncbi:hypothetical protein ARSEF1564_010082 [Beauveria bassiana]
MKTIAYFATTGLALLPATLATPSCAITASGGNPSASFEGVAIIEDCYYHCMANTTCLSWAYRAINQTCWLFPKSVADTSMQPDMSYVRHDRACPTPGKFKPACRRSGPATGYYAWEAVQGGEDICKYNCHKSLLCLAWQYDADMGQCQYFDRPLSKIKACDNGSQSHILSDRDCMMCDVPADTEGFYKKVTVSSVLECRNLCKADSRCKSSEVRLGDRNCWLYDKPTYQIINGVLPTSTWIFYDVDSMRWNDSPAYLASLILHPAFRWSTVESQWSNHQDWLARGGAAVRELWEEYQSLSVEQDTIPELPTVARKATDLDDFMTSIRRLGAQPAPSVCCMRDEYTEWVASTDPGDCLVNDPVQY